MLVAGAENFLGALRWRIFLKMLGMDVPFWKSVQVCLVALFCNTFLLGAAGGDLVRAAYLVRRGYGKTESLLSVIMDRVSGLGALVFYTVALAIWNHEWLMRSDIVVKLFAFVLLYELGSLALIGVTLYVSARGLTSRLPKWAPFPEFVAKLGAGYAKLAHHWAGTLRATTLSLVMLLGYFAVFWCTARAFGAGISFLQMATLMPVADVISAMPISIGGLGVREKHVRDHARATLRHCEGHRRLDLARGLPRKHLMGPRRRGDPARVQGHHPRRPGDLTQITRGSGRRSADRSCRATIAPPCVPSPAQDKSSSRAARVPIFPSHASRRVQAGRRRSRHLPRV